MQTQKLPIYWPEHKSLTMKSTQVLLFVGGGLSVVESRHKNQSISQVSDQDPQFTDINTAYAESRTVQPLFWLGNILHIFCTFSSRERLNPSPNATLGEAEYLSSL